MVSCPFSMLDRLYKYFFLLHRSAVVSDETYIYNHSLKVLLSKHFNRKMISLRKKSYKLNFKKKFKQADN